MMSFFVFQSDRFDKGKTIGKGLLRKILSDGLTVEEFVELL